MLLVLLIVGVVWVFALVLALALCAAARIGDTERELDAAPVIQLRRTSTRRFRGSAA